MPRRLRRARLVHDAILVGSRDWPHLAGIALAPLVGFAGGCLVGLLSLRIRATYLGPVTLSVAVAFPMIVKRFSWLTGGSSGMPIVRQPGRPARSSPPTPHLWNHLVVVTVAVVAFLCARNLARSPVGLAVQAVATVPLAAAAYGIDVGRYRVLAAGTGAAFGALGGALLVIDTPIVGADSYDLFRSLGYYAAVVVGGAASLAGARAGLGAADRRALPAGHLRPVGGAQPGLRRPAADLGVRGPRRPGRRHPAVAVGPCVRVTEPPRHPAVEQPPGAPNVTSAAR